MLPGGLLPSLLEVFSCSGAVGSPGQPGPLCQHHMALLSPEGFGNLAEDIPVPPISSMGIFL